MKEKLLFFAFLITLCSCSAQVKPSSLTANSTMPSNFEFQDLLNKQRITAENARGYYNAGVVSTPISFVPSASGNTAYINAFVKDPTGDVWFIDFTGKAMKMGSSAAAQVNSDWSATSGVSQILNKPTIPAAQVNSDWSATSGVSQILNKPTIPAAQVNSDWNSTTGVSQILNKPTLAAVATTGNYGDLLGVPPDINIYNSNGNISETRNVTFNVDDGELILYGGKKEFASNTMIPLVLREDYDATGVVGELGIGLTLKSIDVSGNNTDYVSKFYNFDGALNIEHPNYINLVSQNGLALNAPNQVDLNTQDGFLNLGKNTNGSITSGYFSYGAIDGNTPSTVSQMYFQGGVGNANSFFKLSNYKNTRNDVGTPVNVITTDASGIFQSHHISELNTTTASNGLTSVNGDMRLGGTTTSPATIFSDRQIDFTNTNSGAEGQLILNTGSGTTKFPLLLNNDNSGEQSGFEIKTKSGSVSNLDKIYSYGSFFNIETGGTSRQLQLTSSAGTLLSIPASIVNNQNNFAGVVPYSFKAIMQTDTMVFGRVSQAMGNYLQITNYKNTRNDAGTPVNVLCTDNKGVLQSHPASELPGASVSGVYDLTINTNGINTSSKGFYTKTGNMVTVSFFVDFNVSAVSAVTLVNLPFARTSPFANYFDVKGSVNIANRAANSSISNINPCIIVAQSSNAKIEWTTPLVTGSGAILQGQFTYEITPSY